MFSSEYSVSHLHLKSVILIDTLSTGKKGKAIPVTGREGP
jgi:hypothetical protein